MISMLHGKVFDRDEECLHLETAGVGYQIHTTKDMIASAVMGQSLRLRIYTHVREDLFMLFGFESKNQENLFRSLIKVNGIGPKVALGIISASPSDHFKEMILNKDIKGLSQLPKVGKKTAEQILLKLGELDWSEQKTASSVDVEYPELKKLKSSLINLGFSFGDVQDVLSKVDEKESFETNFKKSLNILSRL